MYPAPERVPGLAIGAALYWSVVHMRIMAWRRAHRKENTVGKSTIWAHFRCTCAAPGAQWAMPESTPPRALAESPPASLPEASAPASAPYTLAVIMERARLADRWGTEQWEAKGVVHDTAADGASGRVIFNDDRTTQYMFPGFDLKLRVDEAEGYFLNITSPQPKVFVLWRKEEEDEIASPRLLTVSFNEGARWMDGGASVDGVALPVDLLSWIGAFVERHYVPEPKKKGRWASNKDKGVGFRG